MDLQAILTAIVTFISDSLIPFLMAIAFFFFIWNAVRYFIIGGANPDSQEKAKSLAIWGILGFVVIVSLWGIVNLFTSSFGFNNNDVPTPDYMERRNFEGAITPTDPCDPTTYIPELCPGGV